jgi:chorismate synthase
MAEAMVAIVLADHWLRWNACDRATLRQREGE